jgi:hypothetical protein
LDPLIKSQRNIIDLTKNFSQLAAKCVVADQKVASSFPTTATMTVTGRRGCFRGYAEAVSVIENTTWKQRTVTNGL